MVGAAVSLLRPKGRAEMRIGALAKAVGTTVRTVRYYEEIGLLPPPTSARRASIASTTRPMSSACASCCG